MTGSRSERCRTISACSSRSTPPARSTVRSLVDGGRLLVEIEPCGRFDGAPEGLDEVSGRSTRRALIEGLFPDAEFDRERAVLRISVPVARS